jgi:hypothetical protein
MSTITIYPAFDAYYYSFYVKGLIETFGERSIHFSSRGFSPLTPECLSFIFKGDRELRIVVDAYDGKITTRQHAALEWCDVYGKVNLRSQIEDKTYIHKCLPIGPSFPIRIWPPAKAWRLALGNYGLNMPRLEYAREHFSNYRWQYKYRVGLDLFAPGASRDDYIFFSSTIWREEEAPRTNGYRALFMKCCKSLSGITFEGGFSPSGSPGCSAGYKEHLAEKRYPLLEWLEKIKCSALVFNTPAVWQSHTFKLAEFLALGKAIISTPLVNELPSPLVHGQHIHYVDGSEDSLHDAINSIIKDRDYRMHLERNAYDYYATFLTPKKVIKRLLDRGKHK